jgi:hypothetical protein
MPYNGFFNEAQHQPSSFSTLSPETPPFIPYSPLPSQQPIETTATPPIFGSQPQYDTWNQQLNSLQGTESRRDQDHSTSFASVQNTSNPMSPPEDDFFFYQPNSNLK